MTATNKLRCIEARELVRKERGAIIATHGEENAFGLMLVWNKGGIVLLDGTGSFKAIADAYDDNQFWDIRKQEL
jgi:hypothetical protein